MGPRKFLLIKPRYAYYPMGLAYVASTLERNHLDYDYVDSFHQELDLENRLRHGNYYAVGSGGLVADYFFLEDLFRRVKQIDKNIPCILGGHIARDVSQELFFRQSPIDFAVLGEAEITLPTLLNKILEGSDDFSDLKGIIYRSENGEPVKSPPQQRLDLREQRVFPSFEFFDHSTWPAARLPIPVITGRGCTGKCTFCSPSHRTFIPRLFEDIFAELDILLTRFHVPTVQFLNEVFFEDDDMTIEFCKEYRKRYNVPFACVLRLDMDPRILEHLKDAGCFNFNIGVESGSDKILRTMGKCITTSQTREFVREAKRVGFIDIISGFMFGNEGETEEDIEKTLELQKELVIKSGFNYTIPYPGTPLFKKARSRGLIPDEYKFLQMLQRCYIHQFVTEVIFQKNYLGKPLLPNLTAIPDERFVEVLHSAYVRFQSLYALAEPRFEVRENKVYVVGKCPICGADYDVEHNIQVPFSPGLSCRNTAIGKCNNNLEFHFNLYKIPELERHARSVRERLKGRKRVAFVGDDYSIKFLLAYDIFGVRIDDILGMCSFYPQMTGQYLYGDAFGNCTPNSLFYTVEEIVGLQPEAMIIAEMSPASRVMQDTLVQMGCDAEKIYPMCPEGTIPYLDGHEYWRPLKTVHSQARVVVWPVGDLGRRLIEDGVLGEHQVVAFADSARYRWKKAFMGKTIVAPEELRSIDFDSIVVATPAEDRGVAWVPIHNDPFLVAKDLYCVSEHSGILYLLYVRGNQMLKHAVPGSTHRDVQP